MPRPRLLDDAKRREICALISVGAGIDAAARYVGCNPTTIRRESGRNPDFFEKLRQAELTAQLDPLRALRRAADTHWRAAAWFLERTHPGRFARRDPESLRPEQFSYMLAAIADEILKAIPDPKVRRDVMRRLMKASRVITRDALAAQ